MTVELFYSVFRTDAGFAGVLGSGIGLRRVVLPQPTEESVREELEGAAAYNPDLLSDIAARLTVYFSGSPVDFPDELDFSGATEFQRRVWRAARRIPRGETRSYGWLAAETGRPGAARAVGQALGRNPLPVIVPCHRVLAADGGLGGFSGGLDMKKLLLALEGIQ